MKRMAVLVTVALTLVLGTVFSSCTTDNDFEEREMVPGDLPGGGNGSDDGDAPNFDPHYNRLGRTESGRCGNGYRRGGRGYLLGSERVRR